MANNSILAKMIVQITANNTQFLGAMAKSNAATASFQKSILSAGKALGVTFGAVQLFNGIKSAIGVMADFEVQMSTVRAITGATGDQFKALEKNALDLGRSTRYTATQVGSLQVEYGRLGFTSKEIINATKSTLNLATATGSDLARSAEIAGSTLRAFQIDAKETGRVTDVIASALNKSALSLDSFGEGIKYVAPVAKATNVSLEETSALMSVLADAGIKGSQAGTSLRRIFTLLTKDGKPLSERLDELAKKGITLADANDEVGLYAQTALLVLANQNERVKELTATYELANGETQRMADIMEDNLSGSIKKTSSAWEGLILRYRESSGYLRDLADDTTIIFNLIGNENAKFITKQRGFLANLFPNIDQLLNLEEYQKRLNDIENASKAYEEVAKGLVTPLKTWDEFVAEQNKKLVENTNKTIENNKAKLAANEALKARIALEKDRNAALSRGQNVTSGVPSVSGFDTSKLNFTPDTKAADSFTAAQKAIQDSIDLSISKQMEQSALLQQNQQSWISFGATVGGILNNVISSDRDFLASVQKTVAGILQANATQIASWLAVKFAKDSATKTPVVAIALLAAAIGVVSGLLGKDWKRGGVGGGGRYGGGNLSSTRSTDFAVASNGSQNSAPTITGVIRGQDLYVILENYKRNNQYTMSGG